MLIQKHLLLVDSSWHSVKIRVQEFAVNVTEDFAEYCADGALSVEVWGNRSSGFSAFSGWQIEQMQAKSRSIADRSVAHFTTWLMLCVWSVESHNMTKWADYFYVNCAEICFFAHTKRKVNGWPRRQKLFSHWIYGIFNSLLVLKIHVLRLTLISCDQMEWTDSQNRVMGRDSWAQWARYILASWSDNKTWSASWWYIPATTG